MEILDVTTDQELQECIALRMEVFVAEQGVPEEEEVDEWDTTTACHHVLIREGGQAVATGRARRYDDPDTAKLQRIVVRRDKRGEGYGRLVIAALEERARKAGFSRAVLDAQCQAEGFYEKLGYRKDSPETFLDAGILHVRMAKVLA